MTQEVEGKMQTGMSMNFDLHPMAFVFVGETPVLVIPALRLGSGILSPEDEEGAISLEERFLTLPRKKGLSGGQSNESWVPR